MRTFIYMVRHGDSPKEGNERTRGLTEKGKLDAQRIAEVLKDEGINTVISSPYSRSILTVEPLAKQIGQEVLIIEDLKERIFTAENERISDRELFPLLEKSYVDPILFKGRRNECRLSKKSCKSFKRNFKYIYRKKSSNWHSRISHDINDGRL